MPVWLGQGLGYNHTGFEPLVDARKKPNYFSSKNSGGGLVGWQEI